MSIELKNSTKSIPNLKSILSSNNFDTVSSFLTNFTNFQNNQNLSTELLNLKKEDSNFDEKLLFEETILFLNAINSAIINGGSENEIDVLKNIEKVINEYGIKVSYIKELIYLIKDILVNLRKRNISNNLISVDWQLAMLEKGNEKISVNLNKFDKVEVAFQFKSFDNKEEEYKNSVVKMGYNEFYEIFQNLKKIDGQLHLFKN